MKMRMILQEMTEEAEKVGRTDEFGKLAASRRKRLTAEGRGEAPIGAWVGHIRGELLGASLRPVGSEGNHHA